jgi:glycosyltransferase involved in cell wall biosynthesis
MQTIVNNTLNLWRQEDSCLIQKNFEVFRTLVAQARDYTQRSQFEAAAVYAQIASLYANAKHCGLFVSPELEEVLQTIGQKVIPTNTADNSRSRSSEGTIKNILHISTYAMGIGGHSKMLWRWIQQDSQRSHSLVLTQQPPLIEVPELLIDAVNRSHGKIYILNNTIGSVISWAKKLHQIAASADLVVLHTANYDVIPSLAFANKKQSPPIVLLNHADHLFWLGANISDVVADLRESGMLLSQERRSIPAERNRLLPIILDPIERSLSRTEAKKQLGLPEDSILLLSIARASKYKTIDGVNFADAHVPLLERYKQAVLIVIGPGNNEDWSVAIERVEGRIKVFGERQDTAVFYQAADIYVDSFPWISNTSLLEAGSYGVPLVSRYPYSNSSSILGADAPGLTDNLIRVPNLEEYTKALSRLVEDEELRLHLGEKTNSRITETHMGNNWQNSLEEVYSRAATLPPINITSAFPKDQISLEEPDVFLPRVFCQENMELEEIVHYFIRMMPFDRRFRHWIDIVKKHGLSRFTLLLPEWFYSRYYVGFRQKTYKM